MNKYLVFIITALMFSGVCVALTVGPSSFVELFDRADVVSTVTIIEKSEATSCGYEYKVRVERLLKGEMKELSVIGPYNGLDTNKKYLVCPHWNR